jgi:hypothetical protein
MPADGSDEKERFLALLCQTTRETMRQFRREHPGEDLYAFALVPSPHHDGIICAFATEQGLDRVAGRYLASGSGSREGDPLPLLRQWLRWANPDDGWYFYGNGDDPFARLVPEYQGKGRPWTPPLCIEALQRLDAEGTFGAGADRERVVIGVTYGEDPEDFARFAKDSNPAAVWARMRQEMDRCWDLSRSGLLTTPSASRRG